MKRGIVCVIVLLLLGAGCASQPKKIAVPELRIERPTNESIVSATGTEITGTTNMDGVYVDGQYSPADQGRFTVPVRLLGGLNTFDLLAGNGFTTTTMTLRITNASPN